MDKEIIWTNTALQQFHEVFLELLETSKSVSLSKKIMDDIYDSVTILSTHPEIYQVDSLKKNNSGNIRAFEKHTHRISYQVFKNKIYILRVRYARKKPILY